MEMTNSRQQGELPLRDRPSARAAPCHARAGQPTARPDGRPVDTVPSLSRVRQDLLRKEAVNPDVLEKTKIAWFGLQQVRNAAFSSPMLRCENYQREYVRRWFRDRMRLILPHLRSHRKPAWSALMRSMKTRCLPCVATALSCNATRVSPGTGPR